MKIPTDWTFKNTEVAGAFDNHVREQLPWYDLATGLTAHVARHFIPHGGVVYDIGASTGNLSDILRDTLSQRRCHFTAIDNAPEMTEHYRGVGVLTVADAVSYEFKAFDCAVLFLCLMFLTVEQRSKLLRKLRELRRPGGAIIVVDKMESPSGYIATVMSRLAMAGKLASGCNAADILAKELSLGGIQRPMARWEIEPATEVFRFGDFAGWVICDEPGDRPCASAPGTCRAVPV